MEMYTFEQARKPFVPWNKGRVRGKSHRTNRVESGRSAYGCRYRTACAIWRFSTWPSTASCAATTCFIFASKMSCRATRCEPALWSRSARRRPGSV